MKKLLLPVLFLGGNVLVAMEQSLYKPLERQAGKITRVDLKQVAAAKADHLAESEARSLARQALPFAHQQVKIKDQTVPYKTTVKFNSLFKSKSGKTWPSSQARAEIEAIIQPNRINPIDKLPGVVVSFDIKRLWGQMGKGAAASEEYAEPIVNQKELDQIQERLLFNFRAFELGLPILGKDGGARVDDKPHEADLCERCQSGKPCRSIRIGSD